ncbi:FAD-dependent monooxygenase [Arthrobacter ginkgonis]|uniref:FAD-dependent monooxygenase n=1 Tax=Arthrobacter ginkgonis TaxID=1630594 RepID=A0ABP7C249_9MICC
MKAVVVGAGIAGLAAAGQLADRGWETTVLEQAPGPRTGGYMIDFFGPGFAAAEAMGALAELRRRGHVYGSVRYVDRSGRTTARLDVAALVRATGGRYFSILRPDIEAVLRDWLPAGVRLRQGAQVVAVEPGTLPGSGVDGAGTGSPAAALLAGGERIEADLLVGADGIHSAVRRGLFGPESAHLRLLGFHVASFIAEDPALAASLGNDVVLTDTLERQAGLYALPDGRVAVFAVEATDEPAVPGDARTALAERFGPLGWRIPEAVAHAGREIYYDVVAQSVVPRWSRGRCVLAGDAAFAVSLLAGQGASLALAGTRLLCNEVGDGSGLGTALAGYERRWRPTAEEQQRAGRRNAAFFVPPHRAGLWARRVALRLLGSGPLSGPALRWAFGKGAFGDGVAGDAPSGARHPRA